MIRELIIIGLVAVLLYNFVPAAKEFMDDASVNKAKDFLNQERSFCTDELINFDTSKICLIENWVPACGSDGKTYNVNCGVGFMCAGKTTDFSWVAGEC